MTKTHLIAAAAALSVAGLASAQVIDGSLDAAYGSALFVQDTPTGFGDSTDVSSTTSAGGSEIDAVYGNVSGGNLNLLVTGNLENNFNKLFLFIDTGAGGQGTIDGANNTDSDFGALQNLDGLTFDSGFDADYFVNFRTGNDPIESFLNFGVIGGAPGSDAFDGGAGLARTAGGAVTVIDQSNVAGITDTTAIAADALAVVTGFEISIPLADLGSPTGDIDVTGFITSGDATFLSNQVIGGVGGAGNLAGPSGVDFSSIAGNQFVTISQTVIPEPASLALLGLGGLGLLRRRA